MNTKRGVVILFFDLPIKEKEDSRNYRLFRKAMRKEGYLFLQESVYVKLVRNANLNPRELEKIKVAAPAGSSVMALPLTLSDFGKLTVISGKGFDIRFFADDTVYV